MMLKKINLFIDKNLNTKWSTYIVNCYFYRNNTII